jgi:hypothetical protein
MSDMINLQPTASAPEIHGVLVDALATFQSALEETPSSWVISATVLEPEVLVMHK